MKLFAISASIHLGVLVTDVQAVPTPQRSVLHLSQARRDLGGTTAGGVAVFGGGCAAGPYSKYVCDEPSDVVDVFKSASGAKAAFKEDTAKQVFERDQESTFKLSVARGWPTACSIGGVAVFLGGGKEGQQPHDKTLDMLDIESSSMTTNNTALDTGLWGQSCAATNESIWFGGGKVIAEGTHRPSMTDAIHILATDESGKPRIDGLRLFGKLSLAREAMGAAFIPNYGVMFVGGTGPWPPVSVPLVDTFSADGHFTWNVDSIPSDMSEYWLGATVWNSSTGYIADNHTLYSVDSTAVFSGKAAPTQTKLPDVGDDSSGIPAARMAQNGVAVEGIGVCYYAAKPTSLVCYSPEDGSFGVFPCSVGHEAGAMTAVGKTVFVAGGADADTGSTTDVVDVFTFA